MQPIYSHVKRRPWYSSTFGGNADSQQPSPFVVTKRMNLVSVLFAFVIPMAFFVITVSVMSFQLRYNTPSLCWMVVGFEASALIWFLHLARVALHRRRMGDPDREPTWYIFLFGTSFVAFATAIVYGQFVYQDFMHDYYDITNLNTYTNVDLSKVPGQMVMDAGNIVFSEKTKIDTSLSSVFSNAESYCVAPIVPSDPSIQLPSYDFWAVGRNCCGGQLSKDEDLLEGQERPVEFHCGSVSNPYAHSGLRLINEGHRAYYALAVQQAEARHNIEAKTPLFFDWVEDPLALTKAQLSEGLKRYLFGILTFCGLQIVLVCFAGLAFWRTGAKQ